MTNNEMDFELEDGYERPDIEATLVALREGEEGKLSAALYYGLSGLEGDALNQFAPVWQSFSPGYRRRVLRSLAEISESNLDLSYEAVARLSLDDEADEVRAAAIELLWEDESLETMDKLIEMALNDPSITVRAAAAGNLGHYILLGELGDLPESAIVRAQDAVIRLWNDQSEEIDVRRRALEAIANCGHEIVDSAIQSAYASDDERLRVSAIFAMGRTCDPKWGEIVINVLEGGSDEARFEAARAAGELELEEAVPLLKQLAFDDDVEVKETAIWSLGEIGGKEAVRALELLLRDTKRSGNNVLVEAIEDALETANLGANDLYMLRLDR